jgi:transcriptional regulator with XRE-family HTH domain
LRNTPTVSDISTRIGRVLRANREQRGLSQEALAVLADVDRSYLGEIERGVAVPSIDTLQKLADGLQEKLSFLISQAEERDE